jgi:hypothetical protein
VLGSRSAFFSPRLNKIFSGDLLILLAANEINSQTVMLDGTLSKRYFTLLVPETRFEIKILSIN